MGVVHEDVSLVLKGFRIELKTQWRGFEMVRLGDKVRLEIDGFDCTAIIVDLKAVSVPEQAGISNFDEEWYS